MKPYRKYLAMIALLCVSFTFLFHVLHYDGATELILFSAFSFLIFAATDPSPMIKIVGALTALTLLGGILFKIMHWAGANTMILAALGFLFPVYLVVYFIRMK